MTAREHTILLVSEDAALRATARRELETIDERRRVASVNSVDAAHRILEDAAPAVILLDETAGEPAADGRRQASRRLDVAVSSLASYAPVVVIGDAEHQTELSGLVATGAADYVVRTEESLTVALGLVERRLRRAQLDARAAPLPAETLAASAGAPLPGIDSEDFGELLRHELNNPLTGVLGNAELLLSEIRRKSDGRLPSGAVQRLETIAALAVRLRETVRRLSQEWEGRRHTVHSS
ncbi:MAG TPA: histidine kinase dimerization/phospho-acceptor domain-containing protein [Candidatus Methylomirabilis sp.]|nr:histidine kinase dimerization/phospho-acceptor domain-containing protein [Candidatus Methylomirabilis sp.]